MKLILFTLCFHLGNALLSFGTSAGDNVMNFNTPALINLRPGFPYYGNTYNSLTIQKDGFVVFAETNVKSYSDFLNIDDVKLASIGIWIAHIGTVNGNIFYRLVNDPISIAKTNISSIARSLSNFAADFTPSYVLVVTWYDVGTEHFGSEGDFKKNTIQLILATDGVQSLASFYFVTIGWVFFEDITNYAAYPDLSDFPPEIPISTKVGFFKGDGPTKFILPLSMTKELKQIEKYTSIGEPGQLIFRVDKTPENVTLLTTTTTSSTPTTAPTTTTTSTTATTPSTTTTSTTSSNPTTAPTTTPTATTTSSTTTTPTTTTTSTTTTTPSTTTTSTTITNPTTTSTTTSTPTPSTTESKKGGMSSTKKATGCRYRHIIQRLLQL
ncbi:cell wall protein DAN4 [Biomphalaria pfeifferi]|uniref:Cell wall protein DAN4 n=1 Tax=Biomphalaria pfeifferi TaxID=112525 RepID=A0AAD8BRC6_BIOPF|nr:cell wall protein DAN4 [Biomphalaria pfeifferi]